MDDVGHSRLLKFFITRMDDLIESNVPGEQIIRGDSDAHYEPVITVTQQETSTSRANITARKITVTEDISDQGINEPVLEMEKLENATEGKSVAIDKKVYKKTQHEEKRSKTKIPMLRKAVRQLIQVEDKKKMEEEIPVQRRMSSIPRLKDMKKLVTSAKAEKENTDPKTVVSPRTEEEFDKLFEEIKQNSDRHSNAFVKDPEKIEMKFEEIIHDYDENKVEPINVEKLKSRIPMLKRKSEHDIEATKLTNWRRVYKKRSSIQNPQHYTKLFLNVQSKASERNRTQSETNVNDSFTTDTEKQENTEREDEVNSNSDTGTNTNVSLGTSKTDPVISTTEKNQMEYNEHVSPVFSSVQNSLETEENRILKKSQSIDSSNVQLKEIQTNSSVRRSLSHIDNLSSNALVQKVVETQKQIQVSEEYNATPITETIEVRALDIEVKSSIDEQPIESTIVQEKDTIVKQDMVCKETSMLIRKNQEHVDMEPSEEPKSLEMEVSYVIESSLTQPTVLISNSQDDSERNNEVKEAHQSNNYDTIDKNVFDNLDQEISTSRIISTDLLKPTICDTETKDTVNGVSESVNLSSQNIDKFDSCSYHEESNIHKAAEELKTESPITAMLDNNKYFQDNKSIKSGDQQIPILGHPDALFNRPETPIEDFLPMIRDSKENLGTLLNTDIPSTEVDQNSIDRNIDQENHEQNKIPERNSDIKDIHEQRRRNKEKIQELLSNPQEEDIIVLKGKVNRVISRLDSKDYSNIKNKPEMVDDVPKKTVLSKIALFEQKEADVYKRKLSRNQIQKPDLPKIVDEVLKQPRSNDSNPFTWTNSYTEKPKIHINKEPRIEIKRELSYAEVDLGDAVKGRVRDMVVRMVSFERMDLERKGIIDIKEKPRSGSVSEKIALFEKKVTSPKKIKSETPKHKGPPEVNMSEEELRERIEELRGAKKYGKFTDLKYVELNDGFMMPALGVGTALLHKSLTKYIICAAIELGYRTIDSAYIYGNEKEIGEAINEKINDGTVRREDLFIISKLWSTFHRRDVVEKACKMSLKAMGLDYFDLYLIHNPMSFKEGDDPIPKIANVIQYSESDYLDAWFGLEKLVKKDLVKRIGVSNFNSAQIDRILDKGRIKPVVNQIECHPYLTQYRLDEFCQSRDVKLSCYGVLGSKGTPLEYTSGLSPVIDDPLVLSMAAGLEVTPAQLLISYQLHLEHSVVVKTSTGRHLWSNLQAQAVKLENSHISALNALNRNKRNFTMKGMGDTHRNYPFRIPF
ncbi:uncharacterized protein LOC123718107 isoform X2 [Pieris brassicae]|uniref:uncharacterized protein LOC123718107 isoform X2 n=1 Tax=Pieris brassicae TaxID=7116 RepID=UPI001E66230A|nr:uncharacterized protein LOC123718107 isoform X2 [Pieris brassicae]